MSLPVVFLLDVDNTLLDNDRFRAELDARLLRDFGAIGRDRYWAIVAELRQRLSFVDYLGALQLLRLELEPSQAMLEMSDFLLEYPFAERIYPRAFEAIAHLDKLGRTAILSDGDIVFQPRKIKRSGIWAAVDGRVLIDVHKEASLDAMQRQYAAEHYVMIDDKPTILAAMKRSMGARLTTVFVHQGHYADDKANATLDSQPDVEIQHIADLIELDPASFVSSLARVTLPISGQHGN